MGSDTQLTFPEKSLVENVFGGISGGSLWEEKFSGS